MGILRISFGLAVSSFVLVACASTTVITDDDSGTPPDMDSGMACMMCGNMCADLKTDNSNCGKCGNACPMGATCVQGSCQCSSGQTRCGNTCVDP
jgi:hypothetical protein